MLPSVGQHAVIGPPLRIPAFYFGAIYYLFRYSVNTSGTPVYAEYCSMYVADGN